METREEQNVDGAGHMEERGGGLRLWLPTSC